MSCAFCDNPDVQKRLVIENDLAFAFLTNTPIVPGHILVITKRHVQYYEESTEEEREAIESLRVELKKAMLATFDAEGFNYAWNEEEIGGQSVPHFHLHIVPRKKGDAGIYKYEPREFLYRPGTRAQSLEGELMEVVESLKTALAKF
jgi:diadenosine tetraphosphate (Ap4A) HIT family hydrolase